MNLVPAIIGWRYTHDGCITVQMPDTPNGLISRVENDVTDTGIF